MTMEPGRTLAHYRLVERIGQGGMGVVWKAVDTTLRREVAIKMLPPDLGASPERLIRLEREARLLASLNHPNITTLYGLHEEDGLRFLAMELVAGSDLSDRLGRGRLSPEEATRLALQVAQGLEAAHRKGVIHRDLKPGNIRITPEGTVKLLDFGLAKEFGRQARSEDPSLLSTVASSITQAGSIAGTIAYMSPEQARGQRVDQRTDIWAFGCVLYEMLTGIRAFYAKTVSDTLAAVLGSEPDWSALPEPTPAALRRLLKRCLRKQDRGRLCDIGDARLELEELLEGGLSQEDAQPGSKGQEAGRRPPGRERWFVAAALGIGLVALGAWIESLLPEGRPGPVMSLDVNLPDTHPLVLDSVPVFAVSPDGSRLVYAGRDGDVTRLFLKNMSRSGFSPLPGTQGGRGPFFSPDGEWVGFFADGKLKKVSLARGIILTLCDAPGGSGGAWAADGTIIFSPDFLAGLWEVSEDGGQPLSLTRPEPTRNESDHCCPDLLPDGDHVLFTIWPGGTFENARIASYSRKTGREEILLEHGFYPQYAASGHLLYAREGAIVGVPFDADSVEVTGAVVPVSDDVRTDLESGDGRFAVSGTGLLVYLPGPARRSRATLLAVDRNGVERSLSRETHDFWYPRYSPDGRTIAIAISEGDKTDVWLLGTSTGKLMRLTSEGNNAVPLWSPDGQRVIFVSDRAGSSWSLYWKTVDGSRPAELLLDTGRNLIPASWSPDGKLLAYTEETTDSAGDMWVLRMEEGHSTEPLMQTRFDERWPMFSPDGRWVAYQSNETGDTEVYVIPFPGPGIKHRISSGGAGPLWSPSGSEIFYRSDGRLNSVSVVFGQRPRFGSPKVVMKNNYRMFSRMRTYDLDPQGGSFAFIRLEKERPPSNLRIKLNLFDELLSHVERPRMR